MRRLILYNRGSLVILWKSIYCGLVQSLKSVNQFDICNNFFDFRSLHILNIHAILVNLWYRQEITGFKINRPTTTSGILLNFLEWRLSVLFWTIYLVIDIRLSKMTSYQFINRTGHLGNDGWGESHEVVFLVYCWRNSRYWIDGHCRNLCYGEIKD